MVATAKASSVLTILVTGAGAPGIRGTLYALRKNGDRRPVRMIGVDADPDVVGRFLVDRFFRVPAPEHHSYLEELLRICRSESVDVVVPQTTREIAVLSRNLATLEAAHVRTMVSGPVAIETANNKHSVLQIFEKLGLPCPAYKLASCEAELLRAVEQLGYPQNPVVVKPPVSNGMRGVRVLRPQAWDVRRFLAEKPMGLEIPLEDLLAILRRGPGWPELLVTEYLPGPEYTVDAFRGEKVEIAVPRLREQIRSGITFRSRTESHAGMAEFTLCAARAIGLQYAFGFQFKLDSAGVPKVLESNPRVQGTMVASVFSGTNVIWMGVQEALGERIEVPPQPVISQFFRFWGGVGVAGECIDEI
jgi:carbamoyl-phosphate synthase large subunit